ncbi:MAG TPA: PAS domain S-box protein [Candidatus Sulfomarinibacteraceae bacterium]|nr:PAS domain S-box protein [Candidatus Sulfomarinibacteraceae bacterium]
MNKKGGDPVYSAQTGSGSIHQDTERALRESEEKYRAMFQLSAVGQAELDLETGRYLSVNARFCEITGYEEAELLQMTFDQITHPDDLQSDRERFRLLAEGVEEEYESEKRYVRKDGQIRWVSARARLIRDADGKPVRSLGSAIDITERIEAEDERERLLTALAQERAQLAQLNATLESRVQERTAELNRANEELKAARDIFYTLFHASPIPIVIARMADGTLIDVNEVCLRYFGWEREEVIGRTVEELHLLPATLERKRVRRALEESGRVRNLEIPLQRSSGERRIGLVSAELANLNGEPSAIAALVDITDRVQTERKVRRLASEVVVAEQRERQRIAQVLHDDVQQMLYSAQLNLHLLSDPRETLDIQNVRVELARIEQLVTDVIDATRSLTTQLQSPAVRQEALESSFQWLRQIMAEQYGLQVEVEIEGDCRLNEVARRELVVRSVRELLFNVVKHAGVRRAQLRAVRQEDRLRVEVADDGVGFDLEAVTSGEDGRTGMGIGIIRERLQLFGGTFGLETGKGEGTRAVIELPLPREL